MGASFWEKLLDAHINVSNIGRVLLAGMQHQQQEVAWRSAAALSHIVAMPGCPVVSLIDSVTMTQMLRLIRECNVLSTQKEVDMADGASESPQDFDRGAQQELSAVILSNLSKLLHVHGFSGQAEIVAALIDVLGEVARSPYASGHAASAAYSALLELLLPAHGNVRETAASVLRQLMPGLLGLAVPGADGGNIPAQRSAAAIRSGIIGFAKAAISASDECRDAVAALARYVVLKAPDKADYRSCAVDCAIQLMADLPITDRNNFVIFTARLSRTAKVVHRMLAVELAPALIRSFADPFNPANAIMPLPQSEGPSGTPARNQFPGTPASSAATPASSLGISTATAGEQTESRGLLDTAATAAPSLAEDASPAPCGTICVALLLQRCSDKSAAVRAKALANLAAVVHDMLSSRQGSDPTTMLHCRQALVLASSVRMQHPLSNTPAIITPPAVTPAAADEPGATPLADTPQPPNSVSASGAPFVQKKRAGLHRALLESAFHAAANQGAQLDLDVKALTGLARKRCSDEKAGVRKAAAQLLEGLLLLRASGAGGAPIVLPSPPDVAVVQAAAADSLASPHPTTLFLHGLTSFSFCVLLLFSISQTVPHMPVSVRKAALGVSSGLLRALPQEASLAQLWVAAALPLVRDVEASLQEQLLDSFHEFIIAPAVAMGKNAEAAARLAPLLAALAENSGAVGVCLSRACAQLRVKKRLRADKVAAAMQTIISQQGMATEAVSGAWLLLAEVSAQDPSAPSWEFLQDAWERVKAGGAQGGRDKDGALLLRVIAHAAGRFPPAQAAALAGDLLKAVRAFTLSPGLAAAHVLALDQLSAAGSPGSRADGWARGVLAACEQHLGRFVDACGNGKVAASDDTASADWQTMTAIFTAGEVVLLRQAKPSGRLVVLVQALTAPKLATLESTPSSVPAPIQAHAWVALGKVCLTDEATAKKCLPRFIQELGRATNPAVRNNIMVALTDLTVQYTALVDAQVPRLAACLADPHELVRRQTLALLASLLSRDYVKWRGHLFHRFLRALVDDSARVRSLAEYLLADTLSTKAPLLAYNHFVEAVFVLNECRAGLQASGPLEEPLSQAPGSEEAAGAFSLAGPASRGKRDTIYRALLRRMAPEHKFATAARLCSEVLSGFAEGTLPLDSAAEVLRDALNILASKDIKVVGARGAAAAEEEEASGGPGAAVRAEGAAKGRLVGAMMKKYLGEGMVPVLLELKRCLEAARHPLLGDLLAAFRALLRDHKNEIQDILGDDKQLAQEILYDLKHDPPAAAAATKPAGAAAESPRQRVAEAAQRPVRQQRGASRLAQQSFGTPAPQGTVRLPNQKIQGLPAGVHASTPVAAEVLRSSATPAAAAGASAGRPARPPGGMLPHTTPGPGRTPASAQRPGHPQTGPDRQPMQTMVSTPASAGLALGRTPASRGRYSPADFKTPGSQRQPNGSMQSPGVSAGGGTPSMSVPRVRTSSKARPSRLRPGNPATPTVQQDEGPAANDDEDEGENWDVNRPADINLPSPERVDKVSKEWNIAEDTWKGGKGAKKTAPSATKLAAAAQLTQVQQLMEGEVTAAPKAGERPQRKRKITTN
ncbi:probable condensin complex subunit 1 at C-terminar half [Coccomyxa sp. Obi]|nr:probable condensin complex subunit 1 at C-terminar half [Coccomyxa sp. Obi]